MQVFVRKICRSVGRRDAPRAVLDPQFCRTCSGKGALMSTHGRRVRSCARRRSGRAAPSRVARLSAGQLGEVVGIHRQCCHWRGAAVGAIGVLLLGTRLKSGAPRPNAMLRTVSDRTCNVGVRKMADLLMFRPHGVHVSPKSTRANFLQCCRRNPDLTSSTHVHKGPSVASRALHDRSGAGRLLARGPQANLQTDRSWDAARDSARPTVAQNTNVGRESIRAEREHAPCLGDRHENTCDRVGRSPSCLMSA